MKTVGILGGMGPRATVQFEQMLVERFEGSDQTIAPIISINDGRIPDRSTFLMGKGPDPVPALQHNLDKLILIGAEIIALPCNSACMPRIFNRLTSTATLLSLPQLVVSYIEKARFKKVCLLATDGTTQSHYYQKLCREVGSRCVTLPFSTQTTLSSLIATIKDGRINDARRMAITIKEEIAILGCDGVILGCTELSLVANDITPSAAQAIDSLAILANACVEYSKGEDYAKRFIYS
ncbi:MAG: amino acid racemase [Candidatus Microsaccharimonas sp.]